MIVRLDQPDIMYWYELDQSWTYSDYFASKFPNRREAENKAVQLAAKHPELIQKLQVKDFYGNGIDFEQGELF
jgi:hypothetical protein